MLGTALTIAGLDPSGGAGIAADLRAFGAAGVWGAAVCAALTVQSTRGVRGVHPVSSRLVLAQARELFGDLSIRAMKSGALGSRANLAALATLAREHPRVPLVVDPVMMPTRTRRGERRLDGESSNRAWLALGRSAALVTPNRAEAAELVGRAISTDAEARAAAAELVRAGFTAILVKGGHGKGSRSVDWLATAAGVAAVRGPRRKTPPIHGAGCSLAALVAGRLAHMQAENPVSPDELLRAVAWARERLDLALQNPLAVGMGLAVLDVRGTRKPAR